jgi:outer membrane protein OmpA-like peptidoglycan-associated protein
MAAPAPSPSRGAAVAPGPAKLATASGQNTAVAKAPNRAGPARSTRAAAASRTHPQPVDPKAAAEEARDVAFERAREAKMDSVQHALDAEEHTLVLRGELLTAVHFDRDQYVVPQRERKSVDRKVAILRANPTVHVRIEGVADDRSSTAENDGLAMRRAKALFDYFTSRGIAKNRLSIATNEADVLACAADPTSCSSDNRRDDLVITAGGETLVSP